MVQRILDSKEAYFFAITANGIVIVLINIDDTPRHIVLNEEKSKEFLTAIHQ
jgi:hypothetical protein